MAASKSVAIHKKTKKYKFEFEVRDLHLQYPRLRVKSLTFEKQSLSSGSVYEVSGIRCDCCNYRHETNCAFEIGFGLERLVHFPPARAAEYVLKISTSLSAGKCLGKECCEKSKCNLSFRAAFKILDPSSGKNLALLTNDDFSFTRKLEACFQGERCDFVIAAESVKIIVDSEVAWNEYTSIISTPAQTRGSSRYEDFDKLIRDKAFTDVTIYCDGKAINTHKFVLAARSDVLRAMLESPLRESQNGVIVIEDFGYEVTQIFVDFLNSDKVSQDALKVYWKDLFALADKYNVERLKRTCEAHFVEKGISVENCADSFIMADLYRSDLIFDKALKTLKASKKEVEMTEGWKRLMNCPKVMLDIALKLL